MLVLGAWCFCFPVHAATNQNILLIIADDYGADGSSLYNTTNNGASLPPTPNINTLAQRGVTFRYGYANPVCSPTRAAILTGRHAFRTGVGDVIAGVGSATLKASEFTLPDAFAAAAPGYSLASFGKWHLANGPNSPAIIGGWPHHAGTIIGELPNYTNWTKTVNGVATPNHTNYATTDVVDDAVAWMQSRSGSNWFAWVAFNAPHTPFHKPPQNLCPSYPANTLTNSRRQFEAMCEAMDTEIGRLLTAVNLTNTHVIFIGDNGTQGNIIQPPYSSAHGKDTLYEGGTRVPFIIAGPAVVGTNRFTDTRAHVVDLFATILEMAGLNVATVTTNVTIDSQSLLPALQSTNAIARYVFAQKFDTNTPTSADGRVLRNDQFKLLDFDDGHDEFYDLSADPDEQTNLLGGALTTAQSANYYSLVLKLGDYQNALTAPVIAAYSLNGNQFTATVPRVTNLTYSLWRAPEFGALAWSPLTNAVVVTGPSNVTLTDTNAPDVSQYYRVEARP